jgi:hypothetical protein
MAEVISAVPGGTATVKSLFTGLMTPSISGPITFSPWSLSGEPGVALFSPLFSAAGRLVFDASVLDDACEMGFLQTLVASDTTAVYVDGDGAPFQTLRIHAAPLPIRDGEVGAAPWCKQGDVISVTAERTLTRMEDRPRQLLPWSTPVGKTDKSGNRGRLVSCSGGDAFATWLVVREKATAALHFLWWATWVVDWACSFDFAKQVGTSTGAGGSLTGDGEGEGPATPVTDGPTANKSILVDWG